MGKLKVLWNNFVDRIKRLFNRASNKVSGWTKPKPQPPVKPEDRYPPYNLS